MFLIFCCFLIVLSGVRAECPQIVSPKEWDAVNAKHLKYLKIPVDLVVIQHTVTNTCFNDRSCTEIVRDIQKTHIEKSFLWNIGPSFLVGGTGKLYEGRGWHHVAVHTPGFNNHSIGIAFIGNFNNQEPSPKALNAVKALIQCGVDKQRLTANHKVVIHSQLLSTESPGRKLASKIKSWSDWTNDLSEVKKLADAQEYQWIDTQLTAAKDLVLTTPKQIDFLSNLRDVIAEVINNMNKLAHGCVDTVAALMKSIDKQTNLFIKTLVLELTKLKDQTLAALTVIFGTPDVRKCANSLKEKVNTLFDTTEIKAKHCADKKVKVIDDMIKDLRILSSNAIDYANTAKENTKNCTELNYGIRTRIETCLNSVNRNTKNASKTLESKFTAILQSINTLLSALPATLDLCTKQNLLEAGTETIKIVADFSKCATNNAMPKFGKFGR